MVVPEGMVTFLGAGGGGGGGGAVSTGVAGEAIWLLGAEFICVVVTSLSPESDA